MISRQDETLQTKIIARYITQEPIDENKKLKFQGKEMKDHLDKAKKKLVDKYGSLDDVDYSKAMKVVGATRSLLA